ncbi:MAG: hypothetical protein OEY79_03045 [Anaplasmataceae bacterium]|nr:hypothetical protein [Anaplasmataceae bacterium]
MNRTNGYRTRVPSDTEDQRAKKDLKIAILILAIIIAINSNQTKTLLDKDREALNALQDLSATLTGSPLDPLSKFLCITLAYDKSYRYQIIESMLQLLKTKIDTLEKINGVRYINLRSGAQGEMTSIYIEKIDASIKFTVNNTKITLLIYPHNINQIISISSGDKMFADDMIPTSGDKMFADDMIPTSGYKMFADDMIPTIALHALRLTINNLGNDREPYYIAKQYGTFQSTCYAIQSHTIQTNRIEIAIPYIVSRHNPNDSANHGASRCRPIISLSNDQPEWSGTPPSRCYLENYDVFGNKISTPEETSDEDRETPPHQSTYSTCVACGNPIEIGCSILWATHELPSSENFDTSGQQPTMACLTCYYADSPLIKI